MFVQVSVSLSLSLSLSHTHTHTHTSPLNVQENTMVPHCLLSPGPHLSGAIVPLSKRPL